MSDIPVTPARPVSLFTIIFLFAVFAAFLLVLRYFYHPATAMPMAGRPDNMSKDFDWRANSEARRNTLAELRKKETEQVSAYGWVDQKQGVVRLPIERAMELTAQDYAAKQTKGPAREVPTNRKSKL